jgi:phytoene synthase
MDAAPGKLLDEALKTSDPDRWLSSRFVSDAATRIRLVALYTLDNEWRRAAKAVKTPLAGEIRLAWWSETLDRFAAGGSAEHPALTALGAETVRALMPWLQTAIEARRVALETEGPCEAAEIAAMTAAVRLLDAGSPEEAVLEAARAWGDRHDGDRAEMKARLSRVSEDLRRLPVAAFPAVAHVALVRAYGQGLHPGELEKRLRLAWATICGRV